MRGIDKSESRWAKHYFKKWEESQSENAQLKAELQRVNDAFACMEEAKDKYYTENYTIQAKIEMLVETIVFMKKHIEAAKEER